MNPSKNDILKSSRSKLQIFTTIAEILEWRRSVQGTVGFVPTMGALHEGHATLLRNIRRCCDFSVLSIFVNPTQFAPNEDLSRYPHTFDADCKIAAHENVDILFAPSSEDLYPPHYSTYVEETGISQLLCGEFRPGHFRGVTTIVLKLFNLIRPNLAFFGLKDAQQFFILNKMAKDLHLDVCIEGIATVREPDGLALSSRNVYLSAAERSIAPLFYQALVKIKEKLENGFSELCLEFEDEVHFLETAGFRVQYLRCVSLPQFEKCTKIKPHFPYLIAAAAYLGNTRLIDNIIIHAEKLKNTGIQIHG